MVAALWHSLGSFYSMHARLWRTVSGYFAYCLVYMSPIILHVAVVESLSIAGRFTPGAAQAQDARSHAVPAR